MQTAEQLIDKLQLTPLQAAIYRTLIATDEPVSPRRLVEASGCKTINSLWVHKWGLLVKLRQHGIGHIETVLGEGYRYVPKGGRE